MQDQQPSIFDQDFFMSLKLPYLIMLLRIKRDWETKAVAGNSSLQA